MRTLRGGWWPVIALFLALTALSTFDLYIMAEHTDRYFAWTVQPPMSAAFLGGGYAAGFVLMVLTARERIWVNARVGLATVAVFVWLTLVPTLLHLDRLHFDAPGAWAVFSAWLWTVVYVAVPPWMTVLLVAQHRSRGSEPPVVHPLAPAVSVTLSVQGTLLVAAGALLMLWPGPMNEVWPWDLTPLTGRTTGAWLLALGFAAFRALHERELRRLRAAAATYLAFGLLQLGALFRYAGDVSWGRPAAWLWVVLLSSFVVVGLYGWRGGTPDARRGLPAPTVVRPAPPSPPHGGRDGAAS